MKLVCGTSARAAIPPQVDLQCFADTNINTSHDFIIHKIGNINLPGGVTTAVFPILQFAQDHERRNLQEQYRRHSERSSNHTSKCDQSLS